MRVEPLPIAGAWVVTPTIHEDHRGTFLEWFADDAFVAATGRSLRVAQANCSVSGVGVVRGIHFSDVPPGQGKYITCISGHVRDVIVDIRVGSETFGEWTAVDLDATDRRAVYLSEGLGHGFAALTADSTVVYLCSTPYEPGREHGVDPLDPALGIDWGVPDPVLSPKDVAAPTLAAALEQGVLPDHAACVAQYDPGVGPVRQWE